MGRGKRSVQIDIDTKEGRDTLERLLEDADGFIQSYRPVSLAATGLNVQDVVARSKEGSVCANLSAYGPGKPLSMRRGFHSLVHTASGMNVAEAQHDGDGQPARVVPCQVLDHASGFLLATGIGAALYRRTMEGGSYEATVSLAGTTHDLRSLGQFEGRSGFKSNPLDGPWDVDAQPVEGMERSLGIICAPKHCAAVDGMFVGFERMLGLHVSDTAARL